MTTTSDAGRHVMKGEARSGSVSGDMDSFKPGVILESRNNHELDCGIVFLARSNVRIRNMTGHTLSLRSDTPHHYQDENNISLLNFEVRGLPLPLITKKELSFALQHEDGSWTKTVSLLGLIGCESRRMMVGGFLLYIESTRHFDEKDKVEMYDYLIEIVSGIRLVNALPYRVEVKYTQEKDAEQLWKKMSSNSLPRKTFRVRIESGDEHLIPVNLQNIEHLQLSFRLNSFAEEEQTSANSKIKFSEAIDLTSFFDNHFPNITSEDVHVHYPNADASCLFKRSVRVRKVRDSSKESVHSDYLSTPTIEFISDLWVQNNSGIPLFYKFKDSKGKYLEVQDCEYGSNQVSPDVTCGNTLANGPVLGLLDCEKIQLKIDTERNIVANEITLHMCKNLKTHINLPSAVHSGIFRNSSWSKQMSVSSTTVMTGEIECDGIWLGICIERGKGIFSNTTIAVITPRYLIRNMTSLDIDFFPVRLWKRLRKSSTDNESQGRLLYSLSFIALLLKYGAFEVLSCDFSAKMLCYIFNGVHAGMRKLAKSSEKHHSTDVMSEEQQTLQSMLITQLQKDDEAEVNGEQLLTVFALLSSYACMHAH